MDTSTLSERLRRPLVGVIAAVFSLATSSALQYSPSPVPAAVVREGLGVVAGPGSDRTAPSAGGDDTSSASEGTSSSAPGAGDSGSGGVESSSLAAAARVPAPGVYRYEVETTTDGESAVQEEQREVAVLDGDVATASVQITARLGGQSQVSVLAWSPTGAMVRSTRIENDGAVGQDCAWSPPFVEFGSLAPDATWSLDSTCQTVVGGVDTTFSLTGTGRVVGEDSVTIDGGAIRVWRLERDRTTSIEASLDDEVVTQQVREQGTLWFDPSRGIVVRSDVTATLSGARTGQTRRIATLQPG